jgi:hypothetical protein
MTAQTTIITIFLYLAVGFGFAVGAGAGATAAVSTQLSDLSRLVAGLWWFLALIVAARWAFQ